MLQIHVVSSNQSQFKREATKSILVVPRIPSNEADTN
jgi:hypothetical protein